MSSLEGTNKNSSFPYVVLGLLSRALPFLLISLFVAVNEYPIPSKIVSIIFSKIYESGKKSQERKAKEKKNERKRL